MTRAYLLRVGHSVPGSFEVGAEAGSVLVTGTDAALTYSATEDPTPDFELDPNDYADKAALLADPRTYNDLAAATSVDRLFLDNTGGPSNDKCIRLQFSAGSTAAGGYWVEVAGGTEFWWEGYAKMDTFNGGSGYKWVFLYDDNGGTRYAYGFVGTALLKDNTNDNDGTAEFPGPVTSDFNTWRRFRAYLKVTSPVRWTTWLDDEIVSDDTTFNAEPGFDFNLLCLGINANESIGNVAIRWGRQRVWYAGNDPGWT